MQNRSFIIIIIIVIYPRRDRYIAVSHQASPEDLAKN